MADRIPLRIVTVSGVPTIGEFQSGDTVGVVHGGTGVSSLNELADLLDAIPGGALSSLTDDVGIGFPFSDPAYGDVLTWTGSRWEAEHVPHLAFKDYSGAPYDISSVSFLTNLGSITLQEGEIAWDGTASTIQVQTDASTTQLAVLQVSSASNDGDILLWDGTNGYYYPTSAFVDVSSQVDLNTSTLENTLDASDLSVELSAISTELSAIAVDISAVGIEVSSVSVQLSSLVSSIHLSGLGDTTFTDLSTHQHIVYDGASWVNAYNDTTEMTVRNGTASAMSKGDVIAIQNAHNQNLVNVILADASQTSAMPALGILEQDLAAGEEGIAITFGKAQGLNTSGLTEGATAYVSPTTPGTITETKPTDTSHLIQNIGIIMRAHQSNGAIKVTGIGRANDIDNQTRDTLQYVNGSTVMPAINSNYSGLTEWTEGSGSMTDWQVYGEASSNERVYYPDPFNGSSIVWRAYDDGPGDGSPFEGGFQAQADLVGGLDTSKDHRLSVFIKQYDNTVGGIYFGPRNDSDPQHAIFNQETGVYTNNPYFTPELDNPETDEWYLWVGYINASLTTSGSRNYSDLAGIYDMNGGRASTPVGGFNEFTFSSTATTQHLRVFYFNDSVNDGAIGASFWHPRIDALDGNEPSIDDLLKRFTTQHGQLDGLDQNDHPQYVLSSTNSALSAQVDANTSAIDDAYQLSDIEAFIDHGNIAGLSDNDHPQYVLSSTNSALSAQVDTNTSAIDNALDLSDIVTYIEHGDLNGLGDNDHPQYVLSATNSGLSSVVDALGAFSYMQMTSDGTAGTTELNIGRGATQTVVEDGSTNIVWDSANNEFDVSATGTYHVLANLVLDVAATATIDLKIKKNTTAMNTFAAHGVHSAEDPEEVTMQCVFTASAGDTISVTFDELGSNNVTPKSGTNIMVKRLA
jgi:hypothetical protein